MYTVCMTLYKQHRIAFMLSPLHAHAHVRSLKYSRSNAHVRSVKYSGSKIRQLAHTYFTAH